MLYDELQQVTREILSDPDFKQGVTQLVTLTPANGPTDEPGEPVETLHSVDGVLRGVSFKYLAASLAVATDLQITHAVLPSGVVPKIGDFMQVDNQRLKIMQVFHLPPAGVTVAHTLILRK